MSRRVGIIGYGHLGEFLAKKIESSESHELAFVWNRTRSVVEDVFDDDIILNDLQDFATKSPDIIVEVSHPSITKTYGKFILSYCDYMVGSPSVFCDADVEKTLRSAAFKHALYIPSGAFWGGEDIQKMADSGSIQFLKVTMKKHPSSLKLEGRLKGLNANVENAAVTLYDGPVRSLCKSAPQNTNTMAVAAIAAKNLGFDGVQGCLISDPSLVDSHIVEIDLKGFPNNKGSCFEVHTIRKNPANVGAVTGIATYSSFYSSLLRSEAGGVVRACDSDPRCPGFDNCCRQ